MAREKAEKGMAGQKRKSKDESAAAVAVDLFCTLSHHQQQKN